MASSWRRVAFKYSFISYANDLITLCYVSKYFRKLVLKQFNEHYDISTGFCAVPFWTEKIEENVFKLIEAIHSKLFYTYAFDFEGNYDILIKILPYVTVFRLFAFFKMSKVL